MSESVGAERRRVKLPTPIVLALIFLVAINLRPALTSVGPLLPQIGSDLSLDEGVLGFLGTIPLLAFALISPLVHHPARRFGMERTVLASLVLLAVGIVIRSYGGSAGLWVGASIVGCAIAIGNVLTPTIVKRDYPARGALAMGIYSASVNIAASSAAALAVPVASTSGWRFSLAFWAIPAIVVAFLWFPRARSSAPAQRFTSITLDNSSASSAAGQSAQVGDKPATEVPLWKQPTAWLVTAFMGLQSTTFYVLATWLPTFLITEGSTPAQAGMNLFVYQIVGVGGGLLIPALMRRPHSQTVAAITASIPMIVTICGLLIAPSLSILWAIIGGFGSGSSFVVALSLINFRSHTPQDTTKLSGMAQSYGYLFAAIGPVAAGFLAERTGAWTASITLLGILACVQLLVGILVGPNRSMQQTQPA